MKSSPLKITQVMKATGNAEKGGMRRALFQQQVINREANRNELPQVNGNNKEGEIEVEDLLHSLKQWEV